MALPIMARVRLGKRNTDGFGCSQNMGPTIKWGGFMKLIPNFICIKWGGFTKLTKIFICIKWGGLMKLTHFLICIKWGGFMSISPWYLGLAETHSVGWVRAVIL